MAPGGAIIRTDTAGERSEPMAHEVREHVAFTYQKIIWTWHGTGDDYTKTTEVDEAGNEL